MLYIFKRQAKKPQPPARPAVRPQKQLALIDTKDFDAGEPWRANAAVVIARFRAPEDSAFMIRPGARLEFYLRNQATNAGYDNSGGSSDYALAVSTPGIIKTKMPAPAYPTDRHPEVLAYADKGSGLVPVPVQGVNYSGQEVNLSVPAGENWSAVEVYYVGSQGEFRFYAVREGGGIRDWIPIYNNSFAAAHSLDQHSTEEALTMPNPAVLAEGFQLALEIRSPYPVVWNDRARHWVQIDSEAIHIAGADKETLIRQAHLMMTGGL